MKVNPEKFQIYVVERASKVNDIELNLSDELVCAFVDDRLFLS